MSKNLIIKIADFTTTPIGRYKDKGDSSGEEFRDEILIPKLEEAIKNKQKIEINLDGTRGYSVSFLEEVFGGLVRKGFDKDLLLNIIEFKTTNNNFIQYINLSKQYIREATKV